MEQKTKEPQLFILLLLASFASVSAVLYTPALPEMTEKLGISDAQAKMTMTAFLIGYAFGNLPYGPFSNRFGRKAAIFVGTSLATIGSLLIIIAGNFGLFSLLIVGRVIAALGSSVGIKITFTMIGDIYNQTQATKKIAYVMLSFATTPGLAIALGGFLTHRFGWQSCFYFLTVYSALLFLLATLLPETSKGRDPDALNISKIGLGFWQKLKNKKLILCALLMGSGTSFIYLFASEAPFIGIEKIGLRADVYGILNFIPPIGMILGSLLALRLADKKERLNQIMFGAIAILFLGSIAMFLLFFFEWITIWSLFLPIAFVYVGDTIIFSNASAIAMSHARNKSNASAIMNFINLGVSVVALLIMQMLGPHKSYVLPIFYIIISCIILMLWLMLTKRESSSIKP